MQWLAATGFQTGGKIGAMAMNHDSVQDHIQVRASSNMMDQLLVCRPTTIGSGPTTDIEDGSRDHCHRIITAVWMLRYVA
jgi:hypothetical protein